jgi:hypothetical protein
LAASLEGIIIPQIRQLPKRIIVSRRDWLIIRKRAKTFKLNFSKKGLDLTKKLKSQLLC